MGKCRKMTFGDILIVTHSLNLSLYTNFYSMKYVLHILLLSYNLD